MLLVAVGSILMQKVVRDNAEDRAIIEEQEREFNLKVSKAEKETPKYPLSEYSYR
ncbi:hypothetical protein [Brevibacillus formosus]|uniref:hypothetical protein n=1 Tax=Brevibacillus formosus TaxID=54913 RepID=UPI003F1D6810